MERPTPRAIRERLTKIRTTSKGNNSAGHYSITKSDKSASTKTGGTPTGTPRKRTANGNGNGNANGVKKTTSPSKNGGKVNGVAKGATNGKRARVSDEYVPLNLNQISKLTCTKRRTR